MRHKRLKKFRKTVQFFRSCYGFHPPFRVLGLCLCPLLGVYVCVCMCLWVGIQAPSPHEHAHVHTQTHVRTSLCLVGHAH